MVHCMLQWFRRENEVSMVLAWKCFAIVVSSQYKNGTLESVWNVRLLWYWRRQIILLWYGETILPWVWHELLWFYSFDVKCFA